jgi:hypothetical protein
LLAKGEIVNPKIDIAFHHDLISAFVGDFSKRDKDIQSLAACELAYSIGKCA